MVPYLDLWEGNSFLFPCSSCKGTNQFVFSPPFRVSIACLPCSVQGVLMQGDHWGVVGLEFSRTLIFTIIFWEFLLWLRGLWTQLVSMRMGVQSLASHSGLRIWRCRELWCRLQTQLRSQVAVAVAWAGSGRSDSTPSLGTSICRRCGHKKKQKMK